MGKILDGRQAPRGLTLATMCPPLPEGGAAHIHGWLTRNPGALVFTGIMGVPIRRQNFKKLTGWPHAVEAIGMPGLHFATCGTPATSSPPTAGPRCAIS